MSPHCVDYMQEQVVAEYDVTIHYDCWLYANRHSSDNIKVNQAMDLLAT